MNGSTNESTQPVAVITGAGTVVTGTISAGASAFDVAQAILSSRECCGNAVDAFYQNYLQRAAETVDNSVKVALTDNQFAALAAHIIQNPMLNGETIRIDGALRMPPK